MALSTAVLRKSFALSEERILRINFEICKKVSSATCIGALKRVRPFIPKETAFQIYDALIVPYFDYCSPIWDCLSGYLSDKLQKLQNRVARVITKLPFDANSNHLLTTLNWERLSIRRKKRKALMMIRQWMDMPQNIFNVFSLSITLITTWQTPGAPNESVPHIICSPEESCWLAKIQVFRWVGWEILLLIEVLPGNYWLFLAFQPELAVETLKTEDD